jgi:hypothetical protein
MFKRLIPGSLLPFVFLLVTDSCGSLQDKSVHNIKDLDENMIDLRMYHENLGDAIVAHDMDNAEWLLGGLDSVLLVVAGKFDEHRKLDRPFSESYKRALKPSIDSMESALENSNWDGAGNAYTILTRKCNGCHIDRDVDKQVQNWLERKR